jgi:hypothetical protein
MTAIATGVFRRGNETFEKWLRRGSKSFSLEILQGSNIFETNKLVQFLESRKIFHSPLANHFSPVMQSYRDKRERFHDD